MKPAADVRLNNAVREILKASETAKGASAAEVGVEIAGAVDAVTGVIWTVVVGILIDVVQEDRDLPLLGVETHGTGAHFVARHRQEILIPMFQAVEVIAEEMNHDVDRLQPLCPPQDIRDRAHVLGVGAAQTQNPYLHRVAGVPRLIDIVEATAVEVVEAEEGVQTGVIAGDHTRLQMSPDRGLRQHSSEEEVLQSPQAHLLHQGHDIAVGETHLQFQNLDLLPVTALVTE
jgi:hypothetical protein